MLNDELSLIAKWESEQGDLWIWEKIGRLPFALLDKITPSRLRKWLGQALDELGAYIQTGGQYLVNDTRVLQQLATEESIAPHTLTLNEVHKLSIRSMNRTAESIKQSRVQLATYQGATTGIGGLLTLSIDIPFLLGLSLKAAQEMALSYGYDPLDKKERIFIVQCLQFASADYVGKQAILQNLSTFHSENPERESISQLQGWREVMATYVDNLGWKKLFQFIPIAGILFGAWINHSTVNDVAEAAQMLYRKRRVLEKLESLQ
ncbi:EcsC family protein [Marininema halotolerans]|nr:EcsC family protein [Marininema halotolerans]